MDLTFIRNQIELKLTEFSALNKLYIEGLEKEFNVFGDAINEEQKKEISDLVDELKSYSENADELLLDFGITYTQLTICYSEIQKVFKHKIEEQRKSRTSTFENITIIRHPLKYSQLVDSVGYNKENMLMDIAYTLGGIYRYYNVTDEYYESIKTRNSLKGLRKEIEVYEVKKIN